MCTHEELNKSRENTKQQELCNCVKLFSFVQYTTDIQEIQGGNTNSNVLYVLAAKHSNLSDKTRQNTRATQYSSAVHSHIVPFLSAQMIVACFTIWLLQGSQVLFHGKPLKLLGHVKVKIQEQNMIMGRWTQLGTPCINACLFHPAFCMYYQSVCTKYIASPKNAFHQGLTKKMHTCRVTAPTLDRQVEVDPYSLKWSFRRKRVDRYNISDEGSILLGVFISNAGWQSGQREVLAVMLQNAYQCRLHFAHNSHVDYLVPPAPPSLLLQ